MATAGMVAFLALTVDNTAYSCAKISSGISVTSILGVGAPSP
jgi:hypothetical protein